MGFPEGRPLISTSPNFGFQLLDSYLHTHVGTYTVSQRLVPGIKGGLVPACEVMISTPAVGNLIRENKIHELPLVIETSAEIGMISLNRSLANLIRAKEISLENALNYSLNPTELRKLVK